LFVDLPLPVTTDLCLPGTCDPATGPGYTPIVCNDGNKCSVGTCSNGVCSFTPKNCDDHEVCTIDTCNPVDGSCQRATNSCNDNDPCTIDSCISGGVGCTHTNRSPAPNGPCFVDDCYEGRWVTLPTGDCVTQLRQCGNPDDDPSCVDDRTDYLNGGKSTYEAKLVGIFPGTYVASSLTVVPAQLSTPGSVYQFKVTGGPLSASVLAHFAAETAIFFLFHPSQASARLSIVETVAMDGVDTIRVEFKLPFASKAKRTEYPSYGEMKRDFDALEGGVNYAGSGLPWLAVAGGAVAFTIVVAVYFVVRRQ